MLKVTNASGSITITDSDNNRLTVLKTGSSIEFHSQLSHNRVNRHLLSLQTRIKQIILNPTNDRDNYKVRFANVGKLISGLKSNSFASLSNSLQTA